MLGNGHVKKTIVTGPLGIYLRQNGCWSISIPLILAGSESAREYYTLVFSVYSGYEILVSLPTDKLGKYLLAPKNRSVVGILHENHTIGSIDAGSPLYLNNWKLYERYQATG